MENIGVSTKEMMIQFGWNTGLWEVYDDWHQWVEAIYMTWLYGRSTREIARVLNCDKNVLTKFLERYYGEDAVNPAAKSLLRSLAEDYPRCQATQQFIRDNIHLMEKCEGSADIVYTSNYSGHVITKKYVKRIYPQHRSNHSMDELSKAQCLGELVINRQRSKGYELDAGEG